MRDPVERMLTFIRERKQQAAFEHACTRWSSQISHLLPCLRAVVETFHSGLEEASLPQRAA
jgi:hypothetical protein